MGIGSHSILNPQTDLQKMVTTKNYFEAIKAIVPETLPAFLQEGYDFVKEVTENHTTWQYYEADAEIKGMVDKYLADLSDFLKGQAGKPSPAKKEKLSKNETGENRAREIAKGLIRGYVKRGDTFDQLIGSHMGSSNDAGSAEIKGNKIVVNKIGSLAADFSFPLHSLYNELREELGMDVKPSNTKHCQRLRK